MSSYFVPLTPAKLDWQHTLPYSTEFCDVYHSASGALAQSRHVFIDGNNLLERWQNLTDGRFTIAETGFGTGLNFLLCWQLWKQQADKSARLHYISCEKHPLTKLDLQKTLAHWPELALEAEALLDSYPVLTPGFHKLSFDKGRISLLLLLGDVYDTYDELLLCAEPELEACLRGAFVDAWFLDGFSPAKNQSMWSEQVFATIAMLCKPGTTLASYTASGHVRSQLSAYGFEVVKKKGFGPKKHMISACFAQAPVVRKRTKHSPWYVSEPLQPSNKSAIVVGAGLAGCFIAQSLVKRDWQVTLLEEKSCIALGASANTQAVLFPKLSAYRSPLTAFMLTSFLYAVRYYQDMLASQAIGELKGALILPHNARERSSQTELRQWLDAYPELGELVSVERASQLCGISLDQGGLFIPNSGWINSQALCQALVVGVDIRTNSPVDAIQRIDGKWLVNGLQTDVLILANGYQLPQFEETRNLSIKAIRGQMTAIRSTNTSASLKIPLCADGHVLPAVDGVHQLGASYDLGNRNAVLREEDDWLNLQRIKKLTGSVNWSSDIVSHWAGVRASTPDYLPLVGPVPDAEAFKSLYQSFASNAKRWIPKAAPCYPGLYAFAGFGSRGLTTIPLAADWLAGLICNEMTCLPRSLVQAIAPARFLKRNISRDLL